MFSKIKAPLFAIVIALAPALSAQPRVDLTEGSFFLLGAFSLDYRVDRLSQDDHKLNLISNIGGGYFIADNLAIGFSLPIKWQMLGAKANLGIKPFCSYFFDLGSTIFPYFGGNITTAYDTFSSGRFMLKAGVDAGLLVSMSESVALDFAINPEVTFKLSKSQDWGLEIPAGFIGIRAIF